MSRHGLSRWLRALLLAMALLSLPVDDGVATTPPMYSVYFEYAQPDEEEHGTISKDSKVVLQNAVEAFWYTPDNTVCITGSYDRTGPAKDRMRKSQILAESVTAYLIAHGIPSGSITTVGKGDLDLLVPTEDGVKEPANRHVLVLVGEGNYRPSC